MEAPNKRLSVPVGRSSRAARVTGGHLVADWRSMVTLRPLVRLSLVTGCSSKGQEVHFNAICPLRLRSKGQARVSPAAFGAHAQPLSTRASSQSAVLLGKFCLAILPTSKGGSGPTSALLGKSWAACLRVGLLEDKGWRAGQKLGARPALPETSSLGKTIKQTHFETLSEAPFQA